MNVLRKQIVTWTLLALVTSGALGQIVPVQGGRALDSNYRIGSGRINSQTPRRTTFSSQMYITGQVRGLGAFKGTVGYHAGNQLRMTVPSADLSDFRRQSVGLDDVLTGQTYRPREYLDRSTTALGLGGITSGLTAPGTNAPAAGYAEALVPRKTFDDAMSDFRPLLGKRPGNAISVDIQPAIRLDAAAAPRVVAPSGFRTGVIRPEAFGSPELAVFTVSRPSRRNEVDAELQELERLADDDISRIDSRVRGPVVVQPAGGAEGPQSPSGLGGAGVADKAAVESDVFLKLIYLLQKQHLDSSGKSESTEPVEPAGGADMKLKPLGPRPNSIELVEQGLRGELVFNTLAGKGADVYDSAMRKGEKQLGEGNFYNAANQYRLAVEVSPQNPIPRLGLSVALFGAGESLGAALQLRRAMEMFPPVMVTRLKVIRKIPSEQLKVRLDLISKRLEGRKGTNVDPQLAMLAAYMHYGAGEKYVAEQCALKLKGAAEDDELDPAHAKLYAAYATYVLTGKRPVAMKPTTRPASGK